MKPINYHLIPNETALVIIDMQNGFCDYEGSISKGGGDVSAMNAIIPKVRELVLACREAGIIDIWVTQNHYADDITKKKHRITPHTLRWENGPNPTALKGTWDSQIVDQLKDLAKESSEIVIKHRFSAFMDTRLETLLRMKGVNTLIVCGVATTHCVETTVRDGYQKDYDIIVPSNAVGAMSPEAHEASLSIMNRFFGVVLSTEDTIKLTTGESLELNLQEGWKKRTPIS
jgi:ureidoacrylate peracid hydrolase